jgi:hypothetical protein
MKLLAVKGIPMAMLLHMQSVMQSCQPLAWEI